MSLAIVFIVILAELLTVGWIDIKYKKIANYWIFINVIVSVIFHFILPDLYPVSWEIIVFPLSFIAIGFFLFLMGVMGAGDSKFIATLFLLVPLEYHMLFFEKLILSTILTGMILLLWRVSRNAGILRSYLYAQHWAGIKDTIKSSFSYAPVLVVAWLLLGFNLWK